MPHDSASGIFMDDVSQSEAGLRHGCCRCTPRRRIAYLHLVALLSGISLYADVLITILFMQSKDTAWGSLSALFTTAGWAVSAHQALRHSSVGTPITVLLALVGLGPLAIVMGPRAYLKVKHAHERLNKLKLLIVIVQGGQLLCCSPT
jgi:hypothetical protein